MILFHLFFCFAAGYLGYHFGAVIELSEQWPFFEALRTTTSIVFGVMGALLAVIFPDVLKTGLRGSGASSGEANLRRVLMPCASSAILLIVLVVLAPLFAWVKATTPTTDVSVRQALFCLFCVLTYWQIMILQMVLLPMDILMSNTIVAAAHQRLLRAIHSNGRG
ncbi:MAG: hypothetical protein JWP59_4793 [Massilia sp.]|nr:hypothetical protein [Massilia sp.]